MPRPARLDLMQRQGVLGILRLYAGKSKKLGHKQRLMILGGTVYHHTGTASSLKGYQKVADTVHMILRTDIAAAEITGNHPLFNTISDVEQPQFTMEIFQDGDSLAFTGGANAFITLRVIEWLAP